MTHRSYCEFHLGDNLAHLHFLRHLAQAYPSERFVHAVQPCHIDNLWDAVVDLRPQVELVGLEASDLVGHGTNAWKNAGGYWQNHPLKDRYGEFYLAWFQEYARNLGMESPLGEVSDLLFDYPAILRTPASMPAHGVDVLVVNSRPCSGQLLSYDHVDCLDGVIEALVRAGHRVVVTQPSRVPGVWCTMDHMLSITDIGHLSLHAAHLVMVSTGPSWPTFNVWNAALTKTRILMLERETVELAPRTVHVRRVDELGAQLRARGLL